MSDDEKKYIPVGKKRCSNCHQEFGWEEEHNCIPQEPGKLPIVPYFTGQVVVIDPASFRKWLRK